MQNRLRCSRLYALLQRSPQIGSFLLSQGLLEDIKLMNARCRDKIGDHYQSVQTFILTQAKTFPSKIIKLQERKHQLSIFICQRKRYALIVYNNFMRVNQLHVQDSKSVKEYAYQQDRNGAYRQDMEDNFIAEEDIVGEGTGLFGILDGHGGSAVSQFCAKELPRIFQEEYAKGGNISGIFERVCKRVDVELQNYQASETGSTCCLVFVRKFGGKTLCHIANLGDTRAILWTEKLIARRLSIDHKVSNPSEQDRIRSEGGSIIKGRVAGQLAITRALGDLQLKAYGVSNIPDYEEVEIDEKTQYMVIASDGLWDVCQDQQAVQLSKECQTSKDIAKKLLRHALSNGTRDNTSILVLKF